MPFLKSTSLKLKGGKRKSFYNKNKRSRKSRHSKRKNTRRKNTRRRSKYSKRRKHLRRFKGGASIEQPANVTELITILNENNIDYTKWSKTPENLMEEIANGESYLETNDETGVLVRVVSVAKIKIYKKPLSTTYLIEEYQIKNGKRKEKGSPLAEKIGNGEKPMDGIMRGIKEELGESLAGLVSVDPEYYELVKETKPSQSFQGLECIYLLHNFKGVALAGFHEGPFETQDAHDGKTIGWNWRAEEF
jgi:hypothetical protein